MGREGTRYGCVGEGNSQACRSRLAETESQVQHVLLLLACLLQLLENLVGQNDVASAAGKRCLTCSCGGEQCEQGLPRRENCRNSPSKSTEWMCATSSRLCPTLAAHACSCSCLSTNTMVTLRGVGQHGVEAGEEGQPPRYSRLRVCIDCREGETGFWRQTVRGYVNDYALGVGECHRTPFGWTVAAAANPGRVRNLAGAEAKTAAACPTRATRAAAI